MNLAKIQFQCLHCNGYFYPPSQKTPPQLFGGDVPPLRDPATSGKCEEVSASADFADRQTNQKTLSCPQCGHRYAVKNDIPIFTADNNYYGELSRDKMQNLLKELPRADWKKVIYDYFGTTNPFAYEIIMDETRADFQYLFSLSKESSVLDVGSGWGTIAVPIARQSQVVAVDNTFERLMFLKERCRQDNIDTISLVCANGIGLPFAPGQFDLAILNGVLEWVGLVEGCHDPAKLQLQALQRIYSILKPHGIAYIGIENSQSARYFAGVPDDHVGIPHISYLPRNKANELMLKKKNKPYRTYTYDKDGYSQLLTAAGFQNVEFYYPAPLYKQFSYLMPLDNLPLVKFYYEFLQSDSVPGSTEQKIRELERQSLENNTIAQKVASYAIVAKK